MLRTNRLLRSIRWRMVLTYLCLTIAAFAVIVFTASKIMESFMVGQRTSEQLHEVDQLALELAADFDAAQASALYNSCVENAQRLGGRVLVLDNWGVVQADSSSALNGTLVDYPQAANVLWGGEIFSDYGLYELKKDAPGGGGIFDSLFSALFPEKYKVAYYVSKMTRNERQLGAVFLSVSIQDVFDQIKVMQRRLTFVMVMVALAIVLMSLLISQQLTRPIVDMTKVIRRIGRGELNLRVEVDRSTTEIEELGKTFNDMTERLENTDKFRSEFVSNASHEIKTPLASMKILIESLLYQDSLDEKITREFLGDINSEIDRLSSVVSDLLKLVKIDNREKADLKRENLQLDELCAEAVKRIAPIAQKKNITIQSDIQEVYCYADRLKMEQVATNLLENGVKYTDEGGSVSLGLRTEGGAAVLTVSDTGIGIPAEDIPHIFERFYRVDKARARATGGTGLGLSIVEKIVKLHGGDITVASAEGKGTTFTVTLPLEGSGADE